MGKITSKFLTIISILVLLLSQVSLATNHQTESTSAEPAHFNDFEEDHEEFEDRKYINEDPSVCETIRFQCEEGRPFFDDTGCGCELGDNFDDGRFEEGFDDRFEDDRRDPEDRFEERDNSNRGPGNFDDNEFDDGRRDSNFDDKGDQEDEYTKENFVFERVFELMDEEIDEREIMQMCSNPEDIADFILDKVHNKISDVSETCEFIEKDAVSCEEEIERRCSFGGENLEEARDEQEKLEIRSYSCPVNKEAIVDLCVYHSKQSFESQSEFIEEDCEYQWEDYGQENQRYCEQDKENSQCNEDEFIEDCLVRSGAYDCPQIYPPPTHECNGYWDQEYDDRGCIVEYYCVEDEEEYEDKFDDDTSACPEIWQPVCGENGVTYSNKCFAEQEGVIFHSGECFNCDLSQEDVDRKWNECLEDQGIPEEIVEGRCIVDVVCNPEEQPPTETTGQVGDTDAAGNLITGNVVSATGDNNFNDDSKSQCKKEWENQKFHCEDLQKDCSKGKFINNCISEQKKWTDREIGRIDRRCEIDSKQQIRDMERECSRFEQDKDRCYEEGKQKCESFSENTQSCKSKLTEESFRQYILDEAKLRCKFGDDFVKEGVYSGNVPRQVIEKILDLKESGVSGKFTGILDEEVGDLEDVSEDLEELGKLEEEKGLGYKLKLFLGFAKKIEEDEIQRLESSKSRLETSIETLSKLASNTEDEVMAEILKAQVQELERQKEDINSLIAQKNKKSKGLLQLFGLLG